MAKRLRTIIATPQEIIIRVILSMCKARFGIEEKKERTEVKDAPPRRQKGVLN